MDPHATNEVRCYLDPITNKTVFYSHNKWFGWKIASKYELKLSVITSSHIKTLEKRVIEGKKPHSSYIPNFAGATSVVSDNRMCAWLSVLSMYEQFNIRGYHLLKSCYDDAIEKELFEDLRLFRNKKRFKSKTLVDWLQAAVDGGIQKINIPKNNNGIDYVKDNLEIGYYICLLQNINGEKSHAVGLEMTSQGIVINDSGKRYPFDEGKGLDKSLDNVKCVSITTLGRLT